MELFQKFNLLILSLEVYFQICHTHSRRTNFTMGLYIHFQCLLVIFGNVNVSPQSILLNFFSLCSEEPSNGKSLRVLEPMASFLNINIFIVFIFAVIKTKRSCFVYEKYTVFWEHFLDKFIINDDVPKLI